MSDMININLIFYIMYGTFLIKFMKYIEINRNDNFLTYSRRVFLVLTFYLFIIIATYIFYVIIYDISMGILNFWILPLFGFIVPYVSSLLMMKYIVKKYFLDQAMYKKYEKLYFIVMVAWVVCMNTILILVYTFILIKKFNVDDYALIYGLGIFYLVLLDLTFIEIAIYGEYLFRNVDSKKGGLRR